MAAAVERHEADAAEVRVARLGGSVRRMDYLQAVKGWINRRKEFAILLDECRAEWRRRHPPWVSMDPDNEKNEK